MNTKLYKSLSTMVLLICTMQANGAEVIKMQVEIGKNDEVSINTNIITVDGEKVRVDYLGTDKQKSDTTPYLLTLNNGRSWILGDQNDDEFYCADVDMKDFFRDIGEIFSRLDSFANAEISNDKVELVLQQKGPKILGHDTTHVRIKTTASIKASILLKKFQFELNKIDDIWYAKGQEIHKIKKRWIEALTHTGYPLLDKLSSGLRRNITGPILRQQSVMKLTNVKKDKVDTYTRKLHVVSKQKLKSSEIDKSLFAKPECKKIKKSQTKNAAKSMLKEGKLTL